MTDPVVTPNPASRSTDEQTPSGEIYDLGYRKYDGARLGRRAAVVALGSLSLRNTYGIGRGTFPKVLAFGIAAIVLLPAALILVNESLTSDYDASLTSEADTQQYSDYSGFVQIIVVLFVAAMASELVGNDRKNNTLTLYFSRPIERSDYVLAKMGALALALVPLTLLPQLLIFVGNWLAARDAWDWLSSNLDDLIPIIAGSLLTCVQLAAVGLAIAMFTRSRAFSLLAVLGGLLVTSAVAGIIVELAESTWSAIAILLSPLATNSSMTTVLFGSDSNSENFTLVIDNTPDVLWIAGPLIHAAIALGLALRRYQKAAL